MEKFEYHEDIRFLIIHKACYEIIDSFISLHRRNEDQRFKLLPKPKHTVSSD